MDGTTSRDDKHLLVDMLQQIKGSGAVHPDDIEVRIIIGWFPYKTERPPQSLIKVLVFDSQAPLEYTDPENTRVWLTSKEEAERYIETLQETPWQELNIESEDPIIPESDHR